MQIDKQVTSTMALRVSILSCSSAAELLHSVLCRQQSLFPALLLLPSCLFCFCFCSINRSWRGFLTPTMCFKYYYHHCFNIQRIGSIHLVISFGSFWQNLLEDCYSGFLNWIVASFECLEMLISIFLY